MYLKKQQIFQKTVMSITMMLLPFFGLSAQVFTVFGDGLSASEIYIKKGEQISFEAYGSVKFGVFAPSGGPSGILGFKQYNIVPNFAHGALMARIADGQWHYIGKESTLVADRSGIKF